MPPPKYMPPPGSGKMSARRRVLAQWRGVDLTPLETAQSRARPRRGGNRFKCFGGFANGSRRADIEIVKVWNSLIDPNITAHAQPAGLSKKGTLFVNVDNDMWKSRTSFAIRRRKF